MTILYTRKRFVLDRLYCMQMRNNSYFSINPSTCQYAKSNPFVLNFIEMSNLIYVILILDGELYSGTVADFSSVDALIIKNRLRTEQYDLKHLNGKFILTLKK